MRTFTSFVTHIPTKIMCGVALHYNAYICSSKPIWPSNQFIIWKQRFSCFSVLLLVHMTCVRHILRYQTNSEDSSSFYTQKMKMPEIQTTYQWWKRHHYRDVRNEDHCTHNIILIVIWFLSTCTDINITIILNAYMALVQSVKKHENCQKWSFAGRPRHLRVKSFHIRQEKTPK